MPVLGRRTSGSVSQSPELRVALNIESRKRNIEACVAPRCTEGTRARLLGKKTLATVSGHAPEPCVRVLSSCCPLLVLQMSFGRASEPAALLLSSCLLAALETPTLASVLLLFPKQFAFCSVAAPPCPGLCVLLGRALFGSVTLSALLPPPCLGLVPCMLCGCISSARKVCVQ